MSIFVDESGRFQHPDSDSRFYIVSLILHDQSVDLASALSGLDLHFRDLHLEKLCFHAGPLIRQEKVFAVMDRSFRYRIFAAMMGFGALRGSEIIDRTKAADRIALRLAIDSCSHKRVVVAFGLERDNSNGTSAAISRCGVTAKRNGFAIFVRGAKGKCRERAGSVAIFRSGDIPGKLQNCGC